MTEAKRAFRLWDPKTRLAYENFVLDDARDGDTVQVNFEMYDRMLVALDARVRAADDESSKALEALRLLESRLRGGKPEAALNGGGGVDDTATVGMAVLRGELRSCEVQMMATASLLAQLRDINLS